MITILKLAGISGFLAAGLVTALEAAPRVMNSGPKLYQDRVAADPAGPVVLADAGQIGVVRTATDASPAAPTDCRAQTWPYVSQDCVRSDDRVGARKVVRTITIERRDSPQTSTLVRVPVQGVASR